MFVIYKWGFFIFHFSNVGIIYHPTQGNKVSSIHDYNFSFKFEFYSVPLLKCRGQEQGEKVFNPPSTKHFTHNWVAKVDWKIVENLARVFLYPLLVVAKSSICNLVTHRVDGTRIDANLVISCKLVWDFAPNAAYLSKCWIVISPSNWPRTGIATCEYICKLRKKQNWVWQMPLLWEFHYLMSFFNTTYYSK